MTEIFAKKAAEKAKKRRLLESTKSFKRRRLELRAKRKQSDTSTELREGDTYKKSKYDDNTKYVLLSVSCVKTVICHKDLSTRKSSRPGNVVDNIWFRVSTALKCKKHKS